MIIYGASGHGKVVCDIIKDNYPQEEIIFIDDALKGNFFYNHPVYLPQNFDFINQKKIIGIGHNVIRKKIASLYNNYINAIHSSVVISPSVKIGTGNVIMPNVSCNADSIIGNHVILNTSCSIDHDCRIGDFVHISPNASIAGNVKVGEGTHIGIGATIIQGIKIGKFATIGAGTVVIKDIPDGATVVGVPGKTIKFRK